MARGGAAERRRFTIYDLDASALRAECAEPRSMQEITAMLQMKSVNGYAVNMFFLSLALN